MTCFPEIVTHQMNEQTRIHLICRHHGYVADATHIPFTGAEWIRQLLLAWQCHIIQQLLPSKPPETFELMTEKDCPDLTAMDAKLL